MRIYRHYVISITGIIDIDKLSERVCRRHPGVSVEGISLNDSVDAVRFGAISSGTLITEGKQADFNMDIICFPRHVFIIEYQIDTPEPEDIFLHPDLNGKKVEIRTDTEVTCNPLYVHGWMITFELLDFPAVLGKLQNVNVFEENSKIETHRALKEISLVDSYYIGDGIGTQTHVEMCRHSILCPAEPNDPAPDTASIPVYEGDQRVCFSDGVYRMRRDDSEFLNMYRYLLYRDQSLLALSLIMDKWMTAALEQAKQIRDNLSETNKVYWSTLKRKLEVWDLNFLDIYASTVHSLNTFDRIEISGLSGDFRCITEKKYETARSSLVLNLNTLRYAISNLKTPCESHDEELLQSETEKVNERIMLLSFLAVSIPLLGAIFAPGFTTSSKLIAAVFLFSLPAAYFYLRGMQKRKSRRKTTLDYLKSQRRELESEQEKTRKSLMEISSEDSLDDKTKSQNLEYLKQNQEFLERQLKNLNGEIRKLGGRV